MEGLFHGKFYLEMDDDLGVALFQKTSIQVDQLIENPAQNELNVAPQSRSSLAQLLRSLQLRCQQHQKSVLPDMLLGL